MSEAGKGGNSHFLNHGFKGLTRFHRLQIMTSLGRNLMTSNDIFSPDPVETMHASSSLRQDTNYILK